MKKESINMMLSHHHLVAIFLANPGPCLQATHGNGLASLVNTHVQTQISPVVCFVNPHTPPLHHQRRDDERFKLPQQTGTQHNRAIVYTYHQRLHRLAPTTP